MKKTLLLFLISCFIYNCSDNNSQQEITNLSFSEMFLGKWELSGYQSGLGAEPWADYIVPNERTIIEIVEEQTDFNHGELGDVTSEISVYKINSITGERMENPTLYEWIEFEKEFENFNTYDCHETEKILDLNTNSFTWQTGPACLGITTYHFYKRYEKLPLDDPNTTTIENTTLDESLVGNWKIDEFTSIDQDNGIVFFNPNWNCSSESSLTFNGDGTGEINSYYEDRVTKECHIYRHKKTAWGKLQDNRYVFNFQVGDKVPLDTVEVQFPNANSLKFISRYDERQYWIWTKID